MFGASANLSICLGESFFFLHPSTDPESIPSEDPIVRGSLTLSLTKPKRVKSLVVRLVSSYSIDSGPPNYVCEYGHNIISEVYLQENDRSEREWAKGNHTFMFTLVIPSSTAPFEHCRHGCVNHKIVATAQMEGFPNHSAETSVPIFLVVNPAPVGETSGLHMFSQGYRAELGPYALTANSQHLTVGGLIEFDYRLASVPGRLKIISINAVLDTKFRVKSMKDGLRELKRTSRRTLLFEVSSDRPPNRDTCLEAVHADGTVVMPLDNVSARSISSSRDPFLILQAGDSMHLSQSTRLPLDHIIRPSTLKGTKTPIEIHHELVLRIAFQNVDHEPPYHPPLALKVGCPITLSSCVCMLPSLLVPPYSKAVDSHDSNCNADASNRVLHPKMAHSNSLTCVCNTTKDQLVELYRNTDARFVTCGAGAGAASCCTAKLAPTPV